MKHHSKWPSRCQMIYLVKITFGLCLICFLCTSTYAQVDPSASRLPLPASVANFYAPNPYESLSDDFNGPSVDFGPTGWAYRERGTNDNWGTDSTLVYIEDSSYLVLKGESATNTGSGLVSKDTSQYGFYITKWQVAGQISDNSPIDWHPAIWAAKCDFSADYNCIATGDQRLEIDFMEGFQSSSAGYWHNKLITWNGSTKQTHFFTDYTTNWPTQSEDNWEIIGLEYTPEYLRFWKYENNQWTDVKTYLWTSGVTNNGRLNDGYRKPVYWILSNLYRGTSAPNQDSYLNIDYFYTYKYYSKSVSFSDKTFRIKNSDHNNFLRGFDPKDANTSGDHANVTHDYLNTTSPDQQQWEFSYGHQLGYYFINNVDSDRALRAFDTNNSPTTGDEVPVTVHSIQSWGSLLWKIVPIPGDSGTYYIKSNSGYFLKGASTNTSYATMETDSTSAGTKWSLYDITGPLPDTTSTPPGSSAGIILPSADAFVKGGTSAAMNFGTSNVLEVKESSNVNYDRNSFLKFDISTLSSSTVVSAKVRLKLMQYINENGSQNLHLVTNDTWTETGIVWNNQPGVSTLLGTQSVPAVNGWIEFDVTGIVNSETDSTLSFRVSDALNNEIFAKYHSKEATNAADRPQLVYQISNAGPLTPNADNYAKGGSNANTNYGTGATMEVKESSNANYDRRGFLNFDLSTIGGTVSDAKIRLKVQTTASTSHQLHLVPTDTWTETGLIWNNQPSATTSIATQSVPAVGSWIEFDVTSIVNSESDNSLSVRLINSTQNETLVKYHTKEASNSEDRPQLVYTLNTSGARVANSKLADKEVEDQLEKNAFSFYPNPAFDRIMLSGTDIQGAEIIIYGLNGKKVASKIILDVDQTKIDIGDLQPGVYMVRLKKGAEIKVKKLVIK